ncbi:MAG: DegV family protein [Anaerolineae bacterium]|jgi:DegV family protein with EDD domain
MTICGEERRMAKIAVITDTDSSLPFDVAERHGVVQVPISIRFGNETYRDGYDIDAAAVFARVDHEGSLPQTAAPSPGEFASAFEGALAGGAEAILCLNISSEVSGTCDAARLAAREFEGREITVVDTRQLSMSQGFMVLAAARAAAQGATVEQALAAAMATGERAHLFGALSTLKYLALGGRVSQFAAMAGNVLSIRPILTVRDGKLDLLEKSRTRKRAWARVIDLATERLNGCSPQQLAVLHAAAPDAASEFEAEVRASLSCPASIMICELMPGLSVHTGSGMVGIAFVTPD